MKRIFLLLAAAALIGTMFSSCKSYERCPAYGKVLDAQDTEQPA